MPKKETLVLQSGHQFVSGWRRGESNRKRTCGLPLHVASQRLQRLVLIALIHFMCFYGEQAALAGQDDLSRLQTLADSGDADAQCRLGGRYAAGEGLPKDANLAFHWYQKAAAQGHPEGQFKLGICYKYGRVIAKDPAQAVKWYRAAADQGLPEALNALGLCYEEGTGVEQDKKEAVRLYQSAAERGNVFAMLNLGHCYFQGSGTRKDMPQAVKCYREAAEKGDAEGQLFLGLCLSNGWGVSMDAVQAAKWFRAAAEQGNAEAQFQLAQSYKRGTVVATDEMESVKWFRLAAEQGHSAAQHALGGCLYFGIGTERDEVEALKWLRQAAENGYGEVFVGVCYYYGNGVSKNLSKAEDMFALGATRHLLIIQQGDASRSVGARKTIHCWEVEGELSLLKTVLGRAFTTVLAEQKSPELIAVVCDLVHQHLREAAKLQAALDEAETKEDLARLFTPRYRQPISSQGWGMPGNFDSNRHAIEEMYHPEMNQSAYGLDQIDTDLSGEERLEKEVDEHLHRASSLLKILSPYLKRTVVAAAEQRAANIGSNGDQGAEEAVSVWPKLNDDSIDYEWFHRQDAWIR